MFKPVLSCEHLTNYASVVTLSSDLQRKGGGKGQKTIQKEGGEAEVHKFSAILGVTSKF